MKKTGRIVALFMVLAALCTAVLCGCGDGGGLGGRKDSNTLRFLHIWPEHEVALNKIVNEFMIENPDIKVTTVLSNYQDVDNDLRNAFNGGAMPDVFFQWTHYMYKWVPDGIPMDITSLIESVRPDLAADGMPAEIGKIDSKYYNMPFRATGYAIIYNKTILDTTVENGNWTAPATLEEFEAELLRLKNKTKFVPLAAYGTPDGTMMQFKMAFDAFANIQSGKTEDPNYRIGRLEPDLDNDPDAYSLVKLNSWYKAGYFGNYSSRETVQQAFISGSAAMALLNNNDITTLSEEMDGESNLGVFTIPAPEAIKDKTYVYGGYDGFCIYSGTSKKAAAEKFLRYLVSDSAQKSFADTEKSAMVNANITYEDPTMAFFADKMTQVGVYDIFADYNSGPYGTTNNNLVYNFVIGNNATLANAKSTVSTCAENTRKALRDTAYNYPAKDWVKPTYTRKSFDNTWLTGN